MESCAARVKDSEYRSSSKQGLHLGRPKQATGGALLLLLLRVRRSVRPALPRMGYATCSMPRGAIRTFIGDDKKASVLAPEKPL